MGEEYPKPRGCLVQARPEIRSTVAAPVSRAVEGLLAGP